IRIVSAFSYVIENSAIPKFIDGKKYISYLDLLCLQEVGIITGAFGVGGPGIVLPSFDKTSFQQSIRYFSKICLLIAANPAIKPEILVYPLTEVGQEIYAISDTKTPNLIFFEEFCDSLSAHGLNEIAIADVVAQTETSVRYINKKTIFPKISE